MTTDTNVQNLIINTLTQAQYEGIANPSDTELYLTPDESVTSESVDTIWTGTKAQYDAIAVKDSNTIYNITDDADVSIPILEVLYPVGAIYIGTCATCPLQTLGVGTWELKSSGRVLQGTDTSHAVGTTIEAGLPNITGKSWSSTYYYDFVGKQYGAFNASIENANHNTLGNSTSNNYYAGVWSNFDASQSNPIYGNSDTVQPPAYVVNIWERIS